MSEAITGSELESIAAGVAGAARDGEQVEAYVVRSRETEIKVFGGEVESLAVAEAAGIGVRDGRRRPAGHRVRGLARRRRRRRARWPTHATTRRTARSTPRTGSRRRPTSTASRRPTSTSGATTCSRPRPRRRSTLAVAADRAVLGGRRPGPGRRVDRLRRRRARDGDGRVDRRAGRRSAGRRAPCRAWRWPASATSTQTGYGFDVAAGVRRARRRPGGDDGGGARARACSARPSPPPAGCRWCSTRW